mmetsp:Transcript_19973/g.39656  ORF Transcript_19973/g.39656 Transcript_19973/m.39656 type:complete len:239 (+) Transcript_19973:127-843(+)
MAASLQHLCSKSTLIAPPSSPVCSATATRRHPAVAARGREGPGVVRAQGRWRRGAKARHELGLLDDLGRVAPQVEAQSGGLYEFGERHEVAQPVRVHHPSRLPLRHHGLPRARLLGTLRARHRPRAHVLVEVVLEKPQKRFRCGLLVAPAAHRRNRHHPSAQAVDGPHHVPLLGAHVETVALESQRAQKKGHGVEAGEARVPQAPNGRHVRHALWGRRRCLAGRGRCCGGEPWARTRR